MPDAICQFIFVNPLFISTWPRLDLNPDHGYSNGYSQKKKFKKKYFAIDFIWAVCKIKKSASRNEGERCCNLETTVMVTLSVPTSKKLSIKRSKKNLWYMVNQIDAQIESLQKERKSLLRNIQQQETKLPSERDMRICMDYLNDHKEVQIAARHGISQQMVSRIVKTCLPHVWEGMQNAGGTVSAKSYNQI